MARISAYEASDKSLHRDRKAWMRHEANLLVAEKLRAILTPEGVAKPVGVDTEAHAKDLASAYDVIVNQVGLNTLRDLFAIKFKPSADESEGDADAGDAADADADAGGEGDATADAGAAASDDEPGI